MDVGYGSLCKVRYGSGYGSWSMDRVWARDFDPCLVFLPAPIYYELLWYIYIWSIHWLDDQRLHPLASSRAEQNTFTHPSVWQGTWPMLPVISFSFVCSLWSTQRIRWPPKSARLKLKTHSFQIFVQHLWQSHCFCAVDVATCWLLHATKMHVVVNSKISHSWLYDQ